MGNLRSTWAWTETGTKLGKIIFIFLLCKNRRRGFLGSVLPPYVSFSVGLSVGPRKTLTVLIGFQAANKNHLPSHEVAVRVTMYVYTDRNLILLLQYECTLYTHHGVRSESTRNKTRLLLEYVYTFFFFIRTSKNQLNLKCS